MYQGGGGDEPIPKRARIRHVWSCTTLSKHRVDVQDAASKSGNAWFNSCATTVRTEAIRLRILTEKPNVRAQNGSSWVGCYVSPPGCQQGHVQCPRSGNSTSQIQRRDMSSIDSSNKPLGMLALSIRRAWRKTCMFPKSGDLSHCLRKPAKFVCVSGKDCPGLGRSSPQGREDHGPSFSQSSSFEEH
jgi:hypothetical protein